MNQRKIPKPIALLSPRVALTYLKAHKKDLFWVWIAYQSIKGITTLTLIWIPLYLIWKNNNG